MHFLHPARNGECRFENRKMHFPGEFPTAKRRSSVAIQATEMRHFSWRTEAGRQEFISKSSLSGQVLHREKCLASRWVLFLPEGTIFWLNGRLSASGFSLRKGTQTTYFQYFKTEISTPGKGGLESNVSREMQAPRSEAVPGKCLGFCSLFDENLICKFLHPTRRGVNFRPAIFGRS